MSHREGFTSENNAAAPHMHAKSARVGRLTPEEYNRITEEFLNQPQDPADDAAVRRPPSQGAPRSGDGQ
jgi:hypothetical protein